jgi:hypothetical protein
VAAALAIVLGGPIPAAHAEPLAPPAAPTNISCRGYEEDAVVLYWADNATDETEYRVERAVGGAGFGEVATLAANTKTWKETGIDPTVQDRRYRVRAYRSGAPGEFSAFSAICNNRRVYESAHFRFFYGLRGTSDDCPLIDGNEVCLANDNVSGVNKYVKLATDALEGSVAAFQRVGFTRDAGVHPTLDKIPINVVWCDGGGCAGGGGLGLSPALMETAFDLVARTGDPIPYLVAEHEAFHFQQYRYGGIGGEPDDRWVYEGQARMTQDKICIGDNVATCNAFDDIATGYAGYVPRINWYLANMETSLTLTHYGAALFWAYLTEQYGKQFLANPVENGMDLLVEFWDESDSAPGRDGITVLDDALANMSYSQRFRDIWKDFAVAAYTKNLTGAGVAAKYKFKDMAETGGAYNLPDLTVNQALPLNGSVLLTGETVYPWAAKYYEVQPAADVPVIPIKVTQDTAHQLFYAVLGIQGNNLAYLDTVEARNLDRTLVNNGYSKVVVIVAGLDNLANFRVSINGTQPVLRILNPTTGNKARVGDPAAPDKFLTAVEVVDGAGLPLAGIELGQFSFQVGAQPVVQASIVASSTVQGQHWFVLRAPSQAAAGQYDLTVRYSTILTGTQALAVDYTPRNDADSVLLVDRSGSMSGDKLTAAKNAGRLYVDSWRVGDKIGLISFNQTISNPVDLPLTNWTEAPAGGSRQQAFDKIGELSPGGGTNIGDTITAGWGQLQGAGNNAHDWALVLLSDGKEEASSPTTPFADAVQAIVDAPSGTKKPVIHAVAIGPDADGPRMQWAAQSTGGTYQYVSLPAAVAAAGADGLDAAAAANSLKLNIDSKYRYIATEVLGRQQAFSYFGPKDPKGRLEDVVIPVDKAAAELVLSLSWDASLPPGSKLVDPDGNQLLPAVQDTQHRLWRVPTPKAGLWKLTLTAYPATAAAIPLPPFFVQAALKSDVTLDSFLGTPPEERTPGVPMKILALLTDNAPITGASVVASVLRPNNTLAVNVKLYDDGHHGDGGANDGVYANKFYQTGSIGNYNVTVNAAGTSALVGPFTRQDILSFYIYSTTANPDEDKDRLPDDWERHFYGDPKRYGPQDDPDHDGLSNFAELQRGTDPMDPDTDDDGEADGTDPDPLEPGDGRVRPPRIVAVPWLKKVFIRWTPEPGTAVVRILRGASLEGPYVPVGEYQPKPGEHMLEDTGVANGQPYCYMVVLVDGQGAQSAPSAPSCATPKADPLPPHGAVFINGGAGKTPIPDVTLTLPASDTDDPESESPDSWLPEFPGGAATGVKEMMISNRGDFQGAQWETYARTRAWNLGVTAGLAAVYVKYRDGAGNESVPTAAGILVEPGASMSQQLYLPAISK